jgi:hypothetical protein
MHDRIDLSIRGWVRANCAETKLYEVPTHMGTNRKEETT